MNKLVYIASPIDFVHEASDWDASALNHLRNFVETELFRHGLVGFWPDRAYRGRTPALPEMRLINQAALLTCAAMIALKPFGIKTVGTDQEIVMFGLERSAAPIVVIEGDACTSRDAVSTAINDLAKHLAITDNAPKPVATYRRGTVPIHSVTDADASEANLRWKLTHHGAKLPSKAYPDDVGWDLYACERTVIGTNARVDVPFGLQVAPPRGWWVRITGRSSTLRGRGLHVVEGVIDPGYRGDLFAMCHNVTGSPVVVAKGERIAQAVLCPVTHVRSVQLAVLPESERGNNGYGSSGA